MQWFLRKLSMRFARLNISATHLVLSEDFERADPFYSEANMSVLRRRARDMDAGQNVVEHDLILDGDPVHA